MTQQLAAPLPRLGATFSEAVWEAARLGFLEPDPRDDLSGGDVQRKATSLHMQATPREKSGEREREIKFWGRSGRKR